MSLYWVSDVNWQNVGAVKILVTHFKRCKNDDRDIMC